MLADSGLPLNMWAEAFSTACYLRNMSPSLQRTQTPAELLWGIKPSVKHLRVFGCRAYVHVPMELRHKLAAVSLRGRLVGYSLTAKAYRVLLDSGKVVISRNVVFDETAQRHVQPLFSQEDRWERGCGAVGIRCMHSDGGWCGGGSGQQLRQLVLHHSHTCHAQPRWG